jgi:hypothetical protein
VKYRLFALALSLGSLFGPSTSTAQFNPQDWGWRTTLTLSRGTGGMVALPLDGPLYDRLVTPPHDLRLVNDRGALVPHVIQCGRTTAASTVVTRPVQIINRTYTPKRFSRAVLDFGERIVKNRLAIGLSGQNYRRRVVIEGGDDGTSWETLAENLFLFDIQLPEHSHRVDTLAFSENSFRYLRVTVENMPDDPERIEIHGAIAFYEEPAGNPQLTGVEVVNRTVEQDQTVVTLDLGFRFLPLQSVALVVDDPLFQRGYTVEGRNTITHKHYRRAEEAWRAHEIETPWSSVSRGTFYRRQDQRKLSELTGAVIPHAAYRYLRVTIKNNDDKPLLSGTSRSSAGPALSFLKRNPGANTFFTAEAAKAALHPMISHGWWRGRISRFCRKWRVAPSKLSSQKNRRFRGASVTGTLLLPV